MLKTKLPISVLIAVRNEEKNIRKCLASLEPALECIVVDSASTDGTAQIAKNDFGAKVVNFEYRGGYPKKRQWALDNLDFKGDWILLVDADEVVPDRLWSEIESVIIGAKKSAFMASKGFHFLGKRFRFGGFSHQALVLFRKGQARFEELFDDSMGSLDMEIHERVITEGSVGYLKTHLVHEDFKGLEAYVDRHNHYSTWEAKLRHSYLAHGRYGANTVRSRAFGNSQERRRFLKKVVLRLPFEPTIWFLYHYIFRLALLEGRRGLIACQIRASYIAQVRAKMFELSKLNQISLIR